MSAGLSRDPAVSVPDTKQLVLFLLVPVVFDFARGPRARTVATVALTVGAASAFIGVVQYGLLNYDNLGRRPQGTLSHWMTYSGTLMLVICGSVARLLFDQRDRRVGGAGDAGAGRRARRSPSRAAPGSACSPASACCSC